MKKFMLMLVLVILPLAAIAEGDVKKVTAEELKALQANPNVVVIDSRGGKYFDGEVIIGAVHLPADETNAENLAKVAPHTDVELVFYCSNVNCPASAKAGHMALEAGYKNISKYPGGIDEWREKGLPTSKI